MGHYFGTDGIRGLVGDKLTAKIAYRVGRFLGSYQGKKHAIILGMDTRISSSMLASAFIAGVTSAGSNVVQLGVVTTPMVSFCLTHYEFSFGIMISASHNPYFDNGIKVFNQHGEKLQTSIETEIEQFLDAEIDTIDNKTNQDIGRLIEDSQSYKEAYLRFLLSHVHGDFSSLRVAIDASHGSASSFVRPLMERLHIQADYFFAEPDGLNINDRCGATHMHAIIEKVKHGTYDVGLSFDGDADRMLAVTGEGTLVDGDALLYLHARYTLPRYPASKQKIVMTKMSNLGLKKALHQLAIPYVEVDVGDKYVQAALAKEHLILGGEQSGHVIFLDILNTGDGLLSALKLLELIIAQKQPLPILLHDYTRFPQVLKNVIVQNKKAVLDHHDFAPLIVSIEQALGDDGRILVRPSGTESLIRVMVEAKDLQTCQRYSDQVVDWINETFTY
jgi:phosphoglucosamine mutase